MQGPSERRSEGKAVGVGGRTDGGAIPGGSNVTAHRALLVGMRKGMEAIHKER